ncbi:MAG: B12-binding domain-containing protein, partial [Candidatus Hodarchaeota archaeon]
MSKNALSDEDKKLFDAILDFEEEDVIEQVESMLNGGSDPISIVETCKEAMNEVGRLFQEKEFFLTELIMAGELFNVIMEKLGFSQGELENDASQTAGTVLMGTVAGDVHDIGKNIVCSLLRSSDYKVI